MIPFLSFCFHFAIDNAGGNRMNKSDWNNIFRSLSMLTQLGLIIVFSIGVGFFLVI